MSEDLLGANCESQRQPSFPPPPAVPEKVGKAALGHSTHPTRLSPGRSQVFEDRESPVSEPSHKGRSRSPNGADLSVSFQKERRNRGQRSGQEELRAALGEERPPRGTTPGLVQQLGGGRKSPPRVGFCSLGLAALETFPPPPPRAPASHLGSMQPPSDSGGQHGWGRDRSGRRTRPCPPRSSQHT